MMNDQVWQEKVTLLVNTCDAYEDLWQPFFTLLQRYFKPLRMRIVVNTETKTCCFPGLQIDMAHCDSSIYGVRMQAALQQVQTEYVLLMLDDFFLRAPVRTDRLEEIVSWMDQDRDIVYFNCDVTQAVGCRTARTESRRTDVNSVRPVVNGSLADCQIPCR